MTADLMSDTLASLSPRYFLGHIGGDDFLAIVEADAAPAVADALRTAFASRVVVLYDEDDRRRGWIYAADRSGANELFPLMTLSVAMAFIEPHDERHYAELLDALNAAKRPAPR